MAAASLDQARIVAFALEHGTSAAARRFRVSDGYVCRLKRAATAASTVAAPARSGLRVVGAPSVPVSKLTQIQYAPAPQLVAGARDFFKCPQCDDLVKVSSGTHLIEWLAEQNAVHSHLSKTSAPAVSLAPKIVPVLPSFSEASQCSNSAVPVPVVGSAPAGDGVGVVPVVKGELVGCPYFEAVMAIVVPWLVEYWRVPLAVVVGLVVIGLCIA